MKAKIVKKCLLSVLIMGLSWAASAADWVQVSEGTKSITYVDRTSIVAVGPYWKGWVKTEFEENQETVGFPKKAYKETKFVQYFDCQKNTTTITRWLAFDEKGGSVETEQNEFKSKDLSEPVPDTVGEQVAKAVCGYVAPTRKPAKKK